MRTWHSAPLRTITLASKEWPFAKQFLIRLTEEIMFPQVRPSDEKTSKPFVLAFTDMDSISPDFRVLTVSGLGEARVVRMFNSHSLAPLESGTVESLKK